MDITKIREERSKEDGDWDEWPYPTVDITSRITGELKDKILKLTGDSEGEVTLVETEVSGGYSEYTQEDEHSIRVLIGKRQVWCAPYEMSGDRAMARFLAWVGGVQT